MQNCKWTTELVTLGIAVVFLAGSLAPSKAQAQENFAWITNTNGVTWKKYINPDGEMDVSYYDNSQKLKIAAILVPEHENIRYIDVWGCVNLTNIILQPARPVKTLSTATLTISASDSGLLNITCKKTMRDLTVIFRGGRRFHAGRWGTEWAVQWTKLKELPKMEIRTQQT